jgi:hypothetical protein
MNAFDNDFILCHLCLLSGHVGLEFCKGKEERKRYAALFTGHDPAYS